MSKNNINKERINKVIDLGLLMSDELTGATINYYGSCIEYYRKLIENLEEHKPLSFQKKKLNDYNAKLKEYNDELSKLYSKMEDEIEFIDEVENIL